MRLRHGLLFEVVGALAFVAGAIAVWVLFT